MRLLLLASCLFTTSILYAQDNDRWIAPEGWTLNYRTLNWDDFKGKEDPEHARELAERNLQAQAYVSPAIYYFADSGIAENGRVTAKFRVKCAFKSLAFVRESTKQDHSNYVLIHEQDHYDIALVYANRLQYELSSRDYSENSYNEEIHKIYHDLIERYNNTQKTYDGEVNPNGTDDKPKQYLWDMRIRKCMENNTEEYFASNENAVISTKAMASVVKRIPGEPALQFAVRARPLYMEFPQEMTSKITETKLWGKEPSVIAFYTQKYYVQEDGALPTYNYRSFGYIFVPTSKDNYKRMLIDTFSSNGKPVKIEAVFFANADSDNVKELIVLASSQQKDAESRGTIYMNRVYDNLAKPPLPGRLKRLDDITAKLSGFEGTKAGTASKAHYKNEKEVSDALVKMGFK